MTITYKNLYSKTIETIKADGEVLTQINEVVFMVNGQRTRIGLENVVSIEA